MVIPMNNMEVKVYKSFDKLYEKFGASVIPLHNGNKQCKYKYSKKTFSVKDFLENDVSGIGLIVNSVKDLICIDIDCKNIDKNDIREIFLKQICNGVYLEESPNGFHIFMKVKNRKELLFNIYEKFGGRFIANNVELFPDFDLRYVVVAPSITEEGRYKSIYGDICNISYVDDKYVFDLIGVVRNIFGARKIKNVSHNRQISNKNVYDRQISEKYDIVYNYVICDEYIKLLCEGKYRRLRQYLFTIEKVLKNNRDLFMDFLKNVGIDVVGENRLAYRVRSILVDDGKNADAYIFKNRLIYYDFHFTNCSVQLLYYLLIDRPKKVIEWLFNNMSGLFVYMLKHIKKVLNENELEWLFEYIITSNSDDKFIVKFKKVFCAVNKSIKNKIKKWWIRGDFGRVFNFIEQEYVNIFTNPVILVNKIRKYVRIKYALSGIITITKGKAEKLSKYYKVDFKLFKRVLEGLSFKYYVRHKRFVRYVKIAKKYLELYLELIECSKLFDNEMLNDNLFEYDDIIEICYFLGINDEDI
jgi:hypothetical protein